MKIALWCVMVAAILPYVTVGIAKVSGPNFDNADPRRWLERQEGIAKRADQAHRNHFEAFPLFGVAIVCALLRHANPELIDVLAVVFIFLRLVYTGLYLANLPTWRTVIWTFGLFTALAILGLAALAPNA
jgi:uncharacterized MAPEG superfamily protein